MKLFRKMPWLTAMLLRPSPPRLATDPADMGTAFGLESVTVVTSSPTPSPEHDEEASPASDWVRRVNGRSRI